MQTHPKFQVQNMIPTLEQLTLEVNYSLPASPSEVIPALNFVFITLMLLKIMLLNMDISLSNLLLHLLTFEIYKNSLILCVFLGFLFLSSYSLYVSKIHLYFCMQLQVIHFSQLDNILLHDLFSQFIYALSHPWKYRLFSVLIYFKECRQDPSCKYLLVHLFKGFSRVHTKEWNIQLIGCDHIQFCKTLSNCFPKWLHQFILPPALKVLPLLHTSPDTEVSIFFSNLIGIK